MNSITERFLNELRTSAKCLATLDCKCESDLLNDAADAIDALEKEVQQQHDHIKMLHDALTKVLETNKWISVEEALPEVGDVVLAMGKRHATTGQFQGIGSKPCYWWWKGKTIKTVTHWRPLPPPPIVGD